MGSALRLVFFPSDEPEEDAHGLSPRMGVCAFYEKYVLKIKQSAGRSPTTIKQDRATLSLWQRLTGDPPIETIDDLLVADFVMKLRNMVNAGEMRLATVAKHLRHLQPILDWTGPKNRYNRHGSGLLPDVPYAERPKQEPPEITNVFTLELDFCKIDIYCTYVHVFCGVFTPVFLG